MGGLSDAPRQGCHAKQEKDLHDDEALHVVFGTSAADTVREALTLLGLKGTVIGLPDPLNVGPIDPPDPQIRQAWGTLVLRADPILRDGLVDDPTEVEKAWAQATAPGIHPVFWACLNSPAEHACFLASAAHMGTGRLISSTDEIRFQDRLRSWDAPVARRDAG